MVFPEASVIYARVPGAASRSILPVLKRLCGHPAAAEPTPTCDDVGLWDGNVELLNARELRHRFAELPIFTVVQDPLARIADCYETVIQGTAPLPAFFEANGFAKSMPLEDFLAKTADLSDLPADNMLRSQASILSFKGELLPTLVLDMAHFTDRWKKLRTLIEQQSGIDIGANCPGKEADNPYRATIERSPHVGRLKKRYRKDYQLFFCGAEA